MPQFVNITFAAGGLNAAGTDLKDYQVSAGVKPFSRHPNYPSGSILLTAAGRMRAGANNAVNYYSLTQAGYQPSNTAFDVAVTFKALTVGLAGTNSLILAVRGNTTDTPGNIDGYEFTYALSTKKWSIYKRGATSPPHTFSGAAGGQYGGQGTLPGTFTNDAGDLDPSLTYIMLCQVRPDSLTLKVSSDGGTTWTTKATVTETETGLPSPGLIALYMYASATLSDSANLQVLSLTGQDVGLAISPSSVIIGNNPSGVISGFGTTWTSSAPAWSTSWAPSGSGTATTISTPAVTSDTTATTTITTGTAPGILTITETISGNSVTVIVAAPATLTPGTATVTSALANTASLTATAPIGGASPYNYQWHRSITSGFTPGAGTLLANGGGISGATSLTLTDNTLQPGMRYYYKCVQRDSASASVTTTQVMVPTLSSPTSIVVGFIGDSITSQALWAGTLTSLLSEDTGLHGVTLINQGVSGTNSNQWVPGQSNYITAKAALIAASVQTVLIMLGSNDCRSSIATSQAAYQANILAMVTDLVTAGFKVIVNAPPYQIIGNNPAASSGICDEAAIGRLQSYQAALAAVVAAFSPTVVRLGDQTAFDYFALHPGELSDGLHQNSTGGATLAYLWHNAGRSLILGATAVGGGLRRITFGGGFAG